MFLDNVYKIGQVAEVKEKTSGEIFKVMLLTKNPLSPKDELFVIKGKGIASRESMRNLYDEI